MGLQQRPPAALRRLRATRLRMLHCVVRMQIKAVVKSIATNLLTHGWDDHKVRPCRCLCVCVCARMRMRACTHVLWTGAAPPHVPLCAYAFVCVCPGLRARLHARVHAHVSCMCGRRGHVPLAW
jgi:hypothetical protein